jgi:leucyl-tRNA synthetase
MPQWAGSCWYYLRFLDPKNVKEGWSTEAADAWMPVDLYIGGGEHAVLHLLYARFWHKVLFELGLVKQPEPFQKLIHQGLILGEVENIVYYEGIPSAEVDKKGKPTSYAKSDVLVSAEHVKENEDGLLEDVRSHKVVVEHRVAESEMTKKGAHWVLASNPEIRVLSQAFKMSKSRGNVVNPDDLIKSHGADSLRLYEMFMGPLEAVKPWQTSGIEGVRRFLDRTWNISTTNVTDDAAAYDDATKRLVHKTIKKVTEDIEHLRFNTAISTMMILVNHLVRLPKVPADAAKTLVLLVSPFAPHMGEELWSRLGGATTLAYEPWPKFDEALVKDDVIEIGVQINGKARASISIPADADEATAKGIALEDAKIKDHVAGKTIKKVIFVKGRILNLIVG